MGIVIFLLIWYFASARNNPKIFSKLKSNKGLIKLGILFLIISSVNSGLLEASIGIGMAAIPFFLIYKFLKKATNKEQATIQKQVQKNRKQNLAKEDLLPIAVPKRIKIIEKFNTKYGLNLTSSQIQTMVDASYISTDWEYLISSMTKEYTTIHQWYKSPIGDWLRTYLKVFNVQSISSDMGQQKQIALDSFDQIFKAADLSEYNTPAWDIANINNKFMTNFDDISFMIAYRFLEANGKKYQLGKVHILKTDEELSDLKEKYDNMAMPSGYPAQ